MKKLLNLTILSIVLYSCSPAKLATISSEIVQLKNSAFVFENDTVKITYHFWADKGIMRFDIYNKLDEPIYFDWKNSAFIPNDQMVSYWQDATNTVGTSSTSSSWLYGGIISSSQGVSKSIHQERIGVIPPHSLITKKDFKLVKTYAEMSKPGNYNKDNSFLNFRNYLRLSLNEKFEGRPMTIDNHFYVSNIKLIHYNKKDSYKTQNSFVVKSSYAYK
jgi:hypothetical protein